MGLSIQISDATFTKYVARALPPYWDTASGFFLFGPDQASSVKNRLPGKNDATLIGTPTYGSNYARTTKANGFLPGLVGGSPFTYALVTTVQPRAIPIGHWNQGGAITEDGLAAYTALDRLQIDLDNAPRATVVASPGVSPIFWAGTHDGTTALVAAGVGGAVATASAAYSNSNASNPLRIGGTGYPTTADDPVCDISAAIIWPVALNVSQLGEVYSFLREVMALRGITVP